MYEIKMLQKFVMLCILLQRHEVLAIEHLIPIKEYRDLFIDVTLKLKRYTYHVSLQIVDD